MDAKEQKLIEASDVAYRKRCKADSKCDEANSKWDEANRKLVEANHKLREYRDSKAR